MKSCALIAPAMLGLCLWLGAGCEEQPQKSQPAQAEPAPAATPASAPRPAGPPAFEIDTLGAKVGYERALLDQRDGRNVLVDLLKPTQKFVEGNDVTLVVERQAKLPWVVAFIDELGKLGAKQVLIKTETRKEFSPSLPFVPELALKSPPGCSPVAMVLEDRGTAVWKLSGGAATKHGKGMAGPDLSMTGDLIERVAKSCKQSSTLFVSAGPSVEWGLTYDLAASAKTLIKAAFERFVLLGETAVPGHQVSLRR